MPLQLPAKRTKFYKIGGQIGRKANGKENKVKTLETWNSIKERCYQLNEADLKGDDEMLLSEAYEQLMTDYQEARLLNEELLGLLKECVI